MGERGRSVLVAGIEELAHVMLKITGYVMVLAPLAVFAAMAAIITTQGLGILVTYGKFVLGVLFSLALLWVHPARGRLPDLRRGDAFRLLSAIREPFLLAFSTASSEAAYPKTAGAAREASASRKRIVSFVLPLGYSFNLDGSMMYCTFAALFIAQAYGIELSHRPADHHAAAADGHLARAWPACRAPRWW